VFPVRKKGRCLECGESHEHAWPHNIYSEYYKIKFFKENGREVTWEDAMAHCSDNIKKAVAFEMENYGIRVNLKEKEDALPGLEKIRLAEP
jgi:hypothetical protein